MSTLDRVDVDTEAGSKPRRPDRAVYVPRALRAQDSADDARSPDTKKTNIESRRQRSPARDSSAHGTPKRSLAKQFCNVYTPPHLRNAAPVPDCDPPHAPHEPHEPHETLAPLAPHADHSAIPFSDNSYSEVHAEPEPFYIGDYFTNGQLDLYRPGLYDYDGWGPHERDLSMATDAGDDDAVARIIDGGYACRKGEDEEAIELKRASREINRSSKRIIKQSFDTDVLVISDPAEEPPPRRPSRTDVTQDAAAIAPKPKLEAKVSLSRSENDWDAVFDDSGECLDPSLLEELSATVGRVRVSTPSNPYAQYQTRGQAAVGAPDAFAHVLEVYDFPSEFKTHDLLALFSEYKDSGFEIKWVDDTHALIVFSSAKIAEEVLATPRSLARCRPLHAATLESRNKAKKCAEFLQPYRQRPETCTALARRLVSGALGVRLSTAQQERAEERRLITRAREKKRQAALHKEAAWDGSLANTTAVPAAGSLDAAH